MPRTARLLAVGALLTVMSLGTSAYAQTAGAEPQPPAATPSNPSTQPPGDPTPQPPPAPSPGPATPAPAPTTPTTHPPVVRPKSLAVTVSPRAGSAGTTVTVRADLRGCPRPASTFGIFEEVHEWGTDALARRLMYENIAGSRYSGVYKVTTRDPAGLGRFTVFCDNSISGSGTFMVRPSRTPVQVRVSPQAGGPGTPVRVIASVGRCSRVNVWFYDSRTDGVTEAGGARRVTAVRVTTDGTLFASYTLTSKVAAGPGRFSVVCGFEDGTARSGITGFRVLASGGAGSAGSRGSAAGTGGAASGSRQVNGSDQQAQFSDESAQFPGQVDTGLDGTSDSAAPSRFGSLLLPAAGLLLVALAGGLWLGQVMARRRS